MRPGATSLNSNMIGDGHPACRLKPASPAVPAASAKEDNKNDNDEKCLGIHNVQPFQCDGSAWASPQYLPLPGTSSGEMPSSLPAPAARRHVRDVAGGLRRADGEPCLVAHDAALRAEEVTRDEVERILYERFRHPRLLSGSHLQPSLHARMETAEIVHDADPFQNRPALCKQHLLAGPYKH